MAPVLTSIDPISGIASDTITLTGTGFGASQDGGDHVDFAGAEVVSYTSWADTEIVVLVPAGAIGGNVNVTNGGETSGNKTFWTAVASAPPDQQVSAFGTMDEPTVVDVLYTYIDLILPDSNVDAFGEVFRHPYILSVGPDHQVPGGSIVISGVAFGSSRGSSYVTVGGALVTGYISWSDIAITCTVPMGASSSGVVVWLVVGTAIPSPSNVLTLIISPYITSLSISSGYAGDTVTITGERFGVAQGAGSVKFNGETAGITSWSDTSIVCIVPVTATDGNVVVRDNLSYASNGVAFDVKFAPVLGALNPSSGNDEIPCTITGTDFGVTEEASTVTFGGNVASVTLWSDTEVTVTVPTGMPGGANDVIMTVAGRVSNTLVYTRVLTELTVVVPNSALPGAQVAIQGISLGLVQGTVTFYPSASATIISWSDAEVVVTVPWTAEPGEIAVLIEGVIYTIDFGTIVPVITSLAVED